MRVLLIAVMAILTASCSTEPPSPPLPPAEQAAIVARQRQAPVRTDVADQPFSSPLSLSDAELILSTTAVFDTADPHFRPGRQVQAFNVILDQPDAADRFRRLARRGQSVGRLYALCGLLVVARADGINFAHSLSLRPGEVTVREGDFWFDTPTVRAVVLVFAEDLPKRLVALRDEAYAYFKGTG
jgi:hypothetical protein